MKIIGNKRKKLKETKPRCNSQLGKIYIFSHKDCFEFAGDGPQSMELILVVITEEHGN